MDKRHKFYWIFFAIAFAFAIVAICRCALYGVKLASDNRGEALTYLLIWAFGPPLWFMIDFYIFKHPAPPATDPTLGQKLAAAVWAAVFATILELVKQ